MNAKKKNILHFSLVMYISICLLFTGCQSRATSLEQSLSDAYYRIGQIEARESATRERLEDATAALRATENLTIEFEDRSREILSNVTSFSGRIDFIIEIFRQYEQCVSEFIDKIRTSSRTPQDTSDD